MKKQEIIDTVNAVIARKAGIDAGEIKPDDFCDKFDIDSMISIEAVVEIEGEFVISISGSDLLSVSTMQDFYDLVGRMIVDTHGFKLFD